MDPHSSTYMIPNTMCVPIFFVIPSFQTKRANKQTRRIMGGGEEQRFKWKPLGYLGFRVPKSYINHMETQVLEEAIVLLGCLSQVNHILTSENYSQKVGLKIKTLLKCSGYVCIARSQPEQDHKDCKLWENRREDP